MPRWAAVTTPMRALAGAPRALPLLAVAATALALLLPWPDLAARTDLLLALLVLVTALGISGNDLRALRQHRAQIFALAVGPIVVLSAVAWVIGRPFGADLRYGLLAVGASSSEVAAVGLVALAGADATIALGAVTGSLIVAAIAGPATIGLLAGRAAYGGSLSLLGHFGLVVLLPLAAGIATRTVRPSLAAVDGERDGVAAVTVAVLVYAALSGITGVRGLGVALAAAALLLVAGGLLGALWYAATAPGPAALPGALTIGMRDFAVAAALSGQAFGSHAAVVPGVYGVLMLVAGSITAGRLAPGRRTPSGRRGQEG